ncbi:hypothetical protein L3Q82_024563 [Scortum barcoo]|uniref:Uncharacterized protein n=1 Tax=Scortum barcoo TaxID=214431 RepID=A0ACB8WPH9_9TELE|nr:hypothetical protein L3Q82_024563 [Scortum barcoo]
MEDLYIQWCRKKANRIIKDPKSPQPQTVLPAAIWPTVLQHLSLQQQVQGQLHPPSMEGAERRVAVSVADNSAPPVRSLVTAWRLGLAEEDNFFQIPPRKLSDGGGCNSPPASSDTTGAQTHDDDSAARCFFVVVVYFCVFSWKIGPV